MRSWINLSSFSTSGVITYANTNPRSSISKISLKRENDHFTLSVKLSDQTSLNTLYLNRFLLGFFTTLDTYFERDDNTNTLSLRSSQLQTFKLFIDMIEEQESSFSQIKQAIADAIGIDLTQILPSESALAITINRGMPEIPQINQTPFRNVLNFLNEEQIGLFSYMQIVQQHLNGGRNQTAPTRLTNPFRAPQTAAPDPALEMALQRSLTTAYRPSRAGPQPGPAKNEQELDRIGFNAEDIPDEYLCALSSIIMTDPVQDPRTPQYIFEKSKILYWLQTKGIHPFTRDPLKAEQLVDDNALKSAIAAFVKEKVEQKAQSVIQPESLPDQGEDSFEWRSRLRKRKRS